MQDKREGNVLVWVGIAVVVIVLLLVFVWKPSWLNTAPSGITTVPPGTPVYAPAGQVVSGFPQSLILDNSVKVNSSYSINYSTTTNQYTAEWISSSSLKTLFGQYKTYLSSNGWTISSQTLRANLGGIYAKSSSSVANVSMFPKNGGVDVLVSYVE